MLLKSTVNVLCKVSVRTYVPEMNVTPRTIASAVSTSRSLCASSPLRVTLRTSASQRAHALKHRVGGGLVEFPHDGAVRKEDDPVRVGGAARIVGDHHDRLADFPHRLLQECQQARGGVGVQVARGLVSEDDVRPGDQGPRTGHPLLLAARQLAWAMAQPVAEPELLHQGTEPC